jgi:hypothetical protein
MVASPPYGGLRTGEVSATIGGTPHILYIPLYICIHDGLGTVSGAYGQGRACVHRGALSPEHSR